jgi:uncharacterized protein involved in exopolysaccharide biosynthesis
MTQRPNKREETDKMEMLPSDVWDILRSHRLLVLGAPLLLAFTAAMGVQMVKPQWEAAAVVQPGQVWQVAAPIETPSRTVERLKFKPFQNAVLSGLRVPDDEDNPLRVLYASSLRVKVLPNTDLIELRVRAYSRGDARRWVEATVQHLRSVHDELARPSIARLEQQLGQLNGQIESLHVEKRDLLKSAELRSEIGPGNRFAENLLLSNLLLQKNAELRSFDAQKLALQEQLDPAKTYPTSVIDKIYSPQRPAFPKRTLTVLLAVAVGLIVGATGAFLIHSLRNEST